MQVTIILDQLDNKSIADWASQGPIWLRRSPLHQQVAEDLWRSGRFAVDHITTFTAPDRATVDETALYIVDTVIQHHPAWAKLIFVGLQQGAALHAELARDHSCKLMELPDRTIIER